MQLLSGMKMIHVILLVFSNKKLHIHNHEAHRSKDCRNFAKSSKLQVECLSNYVNIWWKFLASVSFLKKKRDLPEIFSKFRSTNSNFMFSLPFFSQRGKKFSLSSVKIQNLRVFYGFVTPESLLLFLCLVQYFPIKHVINSSKLKWKIQI